MRTHVFGHVLGMELKNVKSSSRLVASNPVLAHLGIQNLSQIKLFQESIGCPVSSKATVIIYN